MGKLSPGSSSYLSGTQLAFTPTRRRQSVACGAGTIQMNLFGRIFRVFRSYANSLVGGAEDPEKILDQAVNEMQSDLIKMRQSSAQVLASQKQIEAKYTQSRDTAEEWLKRAELALSKGDDELAREALKRKKAFQDNAATMKAQVDAQKKATDQLISNTRMLESKLNEAKSKKNTLKARAKSAQTTRQINEMIQGLNLNNSMAAFERMEEKVMALESESEATLQLSANDNLEEKFKRLEGNDVDDELSQMKKGLLKSGSSQTKSSSSNSLPEGRPIRDAIDWELEELRRKSS